MALSNAERQKRYRARAKNPDGSLLTRCQVWLAPTPSRILAQLARDTGRTKREVIEQLLIAADPDLEHGRRR